MSRRRWRQNRCLPACRPDQTCCCPGRRCCHPTLSPDCVRCRLQSNIKTSCESKNENTIVFLPVFLTLSRYNSNTSSIDYRTGFEEFSIILFCRLRKSFFRTDNDCFRTGAGGDIRVGFHLTKGCCLTIKAFFGIQQERFLRQYGVAEDVTSKENQ